MSLLATLKLVPPPNTKPQTPIEHSRQKLIKKLREQLLMVEAELGGKPYQRTRSAWVPNYDAEPETVQIPIRIRQWWHVTVSGTVLFTVRYGMKLIALDADKAAIEVPTLRALPNVITTVMQAVDEGELDSQLEQLTDEHRAKLRSRVRTPKVVMRRNRR